MSSTATPAHRLRPERRGRQVLRGTGQDDQGAALLLSVLLVLVISGLLLVVTASVLQRALPTSLLQKRTQTLSAAESGLEAALGLMRNATSPADAFGNVVGDPSDLPCSLAGSVGAGTSQLTYAVTIAYFAQDPATRDTGWRADNQLNCTPETGVASTPRYAVVTSTGSGRAIPGVGQTNVGNRVLEATYAFKVTNANIPGGLMWTFGQGHCLQATTSSPGSDMKYVVASECSHGHPLQLFQWDDDYRLRLSTTTTSGATPLCVTGVFAGSADATLQECSATRNDQLFGFEGGARFRGQNVTNTAASKNCLWSGSTTSSDLAGLTLKSGEGCWSYDDPRGSWAPEPKVGAGAAGHQTLQLVNYQQFGRCFDVTGKNIDANYEILYPCKSDPSGGGNFDWNHKVHYDMDETMPQQLTVFADDGVARCLTAPPADRMQPAFPRLRPCTVSGDATQAWVRTEAAPHHVGASYTLTDTYGRCLGVGPPEVWSDGTHTPWSTIVVATCDGSAAQKWNAPPGTTPSTISAVREDVVSG